MADYNGSLKVMSGMKPEGNIPVVSAYDVWVESTGNGLSEFKNLATVLSELYAAIAKIELPSVSTADAGKYLRVSSSGKWEAFDIPYYDGSGITVTAI